MKKLLQLIALFVFALALQPSVYADGPTVIDGKWAGTAFASGAIDLNGDGNGARTFDVRAYGQFTFLAVQGVVDTGIVALPGAPENTCPNPGVEFELEPQGKVTFRGWSDNALFTAVDPSVHLCFNPAAPDETLVTNVIGGTGDFSGATGTVVLRLFDTVLEAAPSGFPLVVDSQGEFTATIQ